MAEFNLLELVGHHLTDHVIARISLAGFSLPLTKHGLMIWIAAGLLTAWVFWSARRIQLVPHGAANLAEAYAGFIRNSVVEPALEEHTDRYLPYFLTLFAFIFLMNLLGLAPGGATATGNYLVSGSLAACTLGLIFLSGIREHGLAGFLKTFIPHGVPSWLIPLMFPLEILGLLIRCSVLCVRLFMNMVAGHAVMLIFFGLVLLIGQKLLAPVAVGVVAFIVFLELIVAFLQAYIFTLLSAVFTGFVLHPH